MRRARIAAGRARAAGILGVLLLAACVAGGAGDREAGLVEASALDRTGRGELRLVGVDGHELTALTYRATGFDPATGPIWFVMHGASRAVERYRDTAAPVAERHGALVVALHFPDRLYPRSEDYTLGVADPGLLGQTRWADRRWREPAEYLYADLEVVFDGIVDALGGEQEGYYLFGHSAGAQFTHRLLTFLPDARVLGAVAANAGWYTLPVAEDGWVQHMPYGLVNSPVEPADLAPLLATPLVVLLGAADTTTAETDDLVRGTREAEAQGRNRLERGRHYFETGRRQAAALGVPFAWRLHELPRAGHSASAMIESAGYFLFADDPAPCTSDPASAAAQLVITEILADPPDGAAGDANGDGTRDPQEDEFVELVNTGDRPLCLEGWALGDAERPERHIFGAGPPLAPGEVLVVFGGGVPTGVFSGARVQWAGGSLGLSNAGDVLTLRDHRDRVVYAFSWGDADGRARAGDHFAGDLGIEASLVRPARADAQWSVHGRRDGVRYSPGVVEAADRGSGP